jgi:hypothetical protein
MGSDVTANGLRFQYTDRIRPLGQRQLEMVVAGQDPKDVEISGSVKADKKKGLKCLISSLKTTYFFHLLHHIGNSSSDGPGHQCQVYQLPVHSEI